MAETPEMRDGRPAEGDFITTLKRVVSVLKQTDVPFALAGGFAAYARGGMSSDHDVDFLIRERDAGTALSALAEAGFRTERPPEDWLVKVYDGDRLVDLIFRPVERPVTDETLALADSLRVDSILVPVMPATTLMVHKILTFSQHYCDFAKALPIARSLREQIDWEQVRRETAESPYAQAFLFLLDRLAVLSHHPVEHRPDLDPLPPPLTVEPPRPPSESSRLPAAHDGPVPDPSTPDTAVPRAPRGGGPPDRALLTKEAG
jgi:hypothetical protein